MDTARLKHMYTLKPAEIRAAIAALSYTQINGQRVSEYEVHEDITEDEADAYTEAIFTLSDGSQVTVGFRRQR